MKIVTGRISRAELNIMAGALFGNMVKAAVDVDRGFIAVDAELHSDLEALLLEDGSEQKNIWGINLYPDLIGDNFVEFDSMINMRPSQNNKSRSVEDADIRRKIVDIISKAVN